MIQNVIFDIGNVLARFHPIAYFAKWLPNSDVEAICGCVFDEIWAGIDRGDYLCDEAKRLHIRKYPQYQKEIEIIYAHWLEMMIPMEETFAFMKECKAHGYHVYLLSNIGIECHEYLAKRDAYFAFADGMVLSYRERCMKPEREIYEILLRRYGLKAQECVFFDDSAANVNAACALGIHAYVFQDVSSAKHEARLW